MPDQPTLLCLNDEQTALSIRKKVLETQGFRVLTATTAEQALENVLEHHVDLVITDHLLRNTTGAEVAKAIRQRCPKVPVILLSGLPEAPDDLEAVDAFVSKGERPEVLFGTIRRLLQSQGS